MGFMSMDAMQQGDPAQADMFTLAPAAPKADAFEIAPAAAAPAAFPDEAKQQAEAASAPAVLEKLNEQQSKPAPAAEQAKTDDDEDAKRAQHKAAEQARKVEFEAKQKAKKEALEKQLAKVAAMSDEEVVQASMKAVDEGVERLTRRNMKLCVAESVQTLCLDDPAFARMVMNPRKNMVNCFHHINAKARDYLQQEMKDNDIKPENGVYGGDVPDDLVYQWAEEYFRDPNAKEDKVDEEKFVPKPYPGGKAKTKPKKAEPKKAKETPVPKPKPKPAPEPEPDNGQMTFGDLAGQGAMVA